MKQKTIIIILAVVLSLLTGCNQSESKEAVNSSDTNSNSIQKLETDHFVFYYKEQDKDCIKDLSNTLDENYTRVTSDLKKSLDKKVEIYIFPDLNTYHKAISMPDAPDTMFAGARQDANIIQMVNPKNLKIDGLTYSDYMKSMVHELVHVVIHNINRKIPLSLDEGVAAYESGLDDGVDETIAEAKLNNKFLTLKDLDTDTVTFGKIGGYQFSYSLVDYTIKTYGFDKLLAFMKTPEDFNNIFGLSLEEFEKNWINYLKSK